MSWKRPRSPVTIQVGRPVATAAPIPEETRPSIPFAPRLARKRTSASAPRQERLLVADRHARGGVDEVAVGVGAARAPRGAPGSVGSSAAVELGRRPRPRRPPPAASQAPAQPRSAVALAERLGERVRERARARRGRSRRRSGSARSSRSPGRRRAAPPRAGRRATGAAACRSASRRSAGPGRASARRAARERSARRRATTSERSCGAEAKLRGRLGEDREAASPRRARRAARRSARVALPPGDDQAPRATPPMPLGERVDERLGPAATAPAATVVSGRSLAALERQRRASR